jgi:hypothetical protein
MPGGRRKETSRYPRTTHPPKQSHDHHLRFLYIRGWASPSNNARAPDVRLNHLAYPHLLGVMQAASPGKACMYVLWYWIVTSLFARVAARTHACGSMQADAFCLPPMSYNSLACLRRSCCAPAAAPPSCISHCYSRPWSVRQTNAVRVTVVLCDRHVSEQNGDAPWAR